MATIASRDVNADLSAKPAQSNTDIWSILSGIGVLHLNQIVHSLEGIAPRPGSVVYVTKKGLTSKIDGTEPVLYSAIDVCTHLQVSRMYFTMTIASGVDFLDFVREKFPFRILEVRTKAELPFTNPAIHQMQHRFTVESVIRDIQHTIAYSPARDEVLSMLSRLTYGGVFEGFVDKPSEQKLFRELVNYLFFHNNHRSLPSLGGKTPLQKLKSFAAFERTFCFDPYSTTIQLNYDWLRGV
ncbi:MAG TPA: hypothetical protein DCP63_12815 [Bacteroidetes bacterium]|nr:hypothetical protein [Bacteroidota bacterium]